MQIISLEIWKKSEDRSRKTEVAWEVGQQNSGYIGSLYQKAM